MKRKKLKQMRKLFKKLDNFIDTMWRNTVASILYYFDNRKDEVDIDWLNMHNNMMLQDKPEKKSKKK